MSYYSYDYGFNKSQTIGIQQQSQQQQSFQTPKSAAVASQQQQLSPLFSSASPTSGSSTSSTSSSYSSRARFMISKGFEFEDDIEFCPEIPERSLFQPQQQQAMPVSNSSSPRTMKMASPSPRYSTTPRVKKALDIVNPLTGMRVGSPQLK